jgi:hypothetical protein
MSELHSSGDCLPMILAESGDFRESNLENRCQKSIGIVLQTK